jgi:hypothetical protein
VRQTAIGQAQARLAWIGAVGSGGSLQDGLRSGTTRHGRRGLVCRRWGWTGSVRSGVVWQGRQGWCGQNGADRYRWMRFGEAGRPRLGMIGHGEMRSGEMGRGRRGEFGSLGSGSDGFGTADEDWWDGVRPVSVWTDSVRRGMAGTGGSGTALRCAARRDLVGSGRTGQAWTDEA